MSVSTTRQPLEQLFRPWRRMHRDKLMTARSWSHCACSDIAVLGRAWWMMPEPGFQKPMPYLAPADDRKSYTSLFCLMAYSRSATPPYLLSLQHLSKAWFASQQDSEPLQQHGSSKVSTGACTVPVSLGSRGALDQMIAVDGGRHSRLGQARRDELQHCHLRCGILHCHPVCTEHTLDVRVIYMPGTGPMAADGCLATDAVALDVQVMTTFARPHLVGA